MPLIECACGFSCGTSVTFWRHCSELASAEDGGPPPVVLHHIAGTAGEMPPLSAAGLRVLREVRERRSLSAASQNTVTRFDALLQAGKAPASPLLTTPLPSPPPSPAEARPSEGAADESPAPALQRWRSERASCAEPATPAAGGGATEAAALRRQLAEAQRAAASARAEATALRALLQACELASDSPAAAAAAAAARVPAACADAAPHTPGELARSDSSAWAAAESRLARLLLWERPARSARVFGGLAYALLCVRWAERARLHPLPLLARSGLVYLAYAFLRRRAELLLGRAPPPPGRPLAAREAAVREAAMAACARAAAAASRAAPLLAELWAAGSQLLSGEAPRVTLRVAAALFGAQKAAARLVRLPPTSLAAAALAAAFTLPLARRALRRELDLVARSLEHVWSCRIAPALLPPPFARPPAALAIAWLSWRLSDGATRVFLAFLGIVHATDVLGTWAMLLASDGGSERRVASSVTLQELEDEDAAEADGKQD